MAAAGFNTVRTYTPPPRWLLDAALRHGLVVMAGLPWEQHVAFLEERGRAAADGGDRPGQSFERRGGQSESLRWQLHSVFSAGCAGAMVFAWTDEWHRGGHDIEDWDFGLVRRDRTPKPALAVVQGSLGALPPEPARDLPRMSVVVCSYNGARTLGECLTALEQVDYPDFEVIVVDDGSSDATPDIAREHQARLICTPNRGLSSARNTGAQEATGEIVYLDDDAAPDPQWLRYLATTFMETDHVAGGGPNIPPPHDGPVASCIANAPGKPVHVMLSDTVAEHIPGCNMAIRRDLLLAIGGFDSQFRIAGDDVDVCWRLQQAGGTIGFSHAAMVWHHRRGSMRMFWRQQRNYGRAEAMLERKWPDKYNTAGHLTWEGRVDGTPDLPGALARVLRHMGHRVLPATLLLRPAAAGPPAAHARVVPGDRHAVAR